MDPISIAMGLATIVPKIVGWIGGDKAEATANKVLDVAKSVTGIGDPKSAVDAIKADPALALQFQQAVMALELALAQEENKTLAEVNATMRAEGASEHWPQWSWRPFWGFSSGTAFLFVALLCCWLGYLAVSARDMTALQMIPQLVGAFATLFAIPGAILGVTAWKRGQEKIEKIRSGGQ
jgi:hypothetical protein